MSQTSERAKARLRNITAIEPLLSALKTISMANWQMALRQNKRIRAYEQQYKLILNDILPYIDQTAFHKKQTKVAKPNVPYTIYLIIGTEHGLCGRFNSLLADNAISFIREQNVENYSVWALGTKIQSTLKKKNVSPDWAEPLPTREIGTYEQAYRWTQDWHHRFEKSEYNRLHVLYNQAIRGGGNKFMTLNLLPFNLESHRSEQSSETRSWPEPIIETDPIGIYQQIVSHFIASRFYQALLQSIIAEYSSRFRIMEEAQQNAEKIITSLTQEIQSERKRRITQEMQELAAGAGLIDNK